MSKRPKKLTLLSKEQINEVVDSLKEHGQVTITNLCVLELKEAKEKQFYNVSTGEMDTTSSLKVSIKKARYLKDRITKTG